MKAWLRKHFLFVLVVMLPTLTAAVYYGLVASDVFTSESRFLVRSPQKQSPTGLGALLQGSGLARSQDDASSVHDYILSRDALKEIDATLDMRKAFANPQVDIFNRFPGILGFDNSFEQFYVYYGKHVSVESDTSSSISILKVEAYTAKDAFRLNSLLLEISERLVNTLNDRSRRDLISFADSEVKLASDKVKDASLALLSYRSKQSVYEPDRQAALQLEGIAKIQQQLITTEAELAQLKSLSPDNPQVRSLTTRAATLRDTIASEASKVTSGNGSLSARAPDFERLALDVEFADKQLGAALAEAEASRAEALQKTIYLERLVQPNLPDKAMAPRRVRGVFTVFLMSMIAWGVASLLIASVREHSD